MSNSPCTALRLLSDFGDLKPGDVIVQNAGGSPVGTAIVQLGRARGLRVVSIVSEAGPDYAPTVERLKLLGSEVGIGEEYLDSKGIRAVMADMPKPKLALNGGTAAMCARLASILPEGTKVVTYCPGIEDSASLRSAKLTGKSFSMGEWLRTADRASVEGMIGELTKMMEGGSLTAWLQRVKFDDLPHAIAEGGVTRRKLVAIMEN